jgi:tetratricopeptide (TPR) repeat protein
VVSIGELVDPIGPDAFAALVDLEPIPRALGHAVDGLLGPADRCTRRSVKLLKVLTVLSRGETLRGAQDIDLSAMKHFDRKEPFFLDNVTQLRALGLLRAKPIMDVDTSFQDPQRNSDADSQKNLIVPKPIRDYVRNRLLTTEEQRDIAQTALNRIFGDGWRRGEPALGWIGRIPRRSAREVQIGPGNPFVVLMWLLSDAVERGDDVSFKILLMVVESFIDALLDMDRFRDVHLISGEVVRFLDSVNRVRDADRLSFSHGRGLRMLGRHQEAIRALERAALYDAGGVSNRWKSQVRLSLAMTCQAVKNHLGAKDYAREVVQLAGSESAAGYQARSILLELDGSLSEVQRREQLKYLWQRARKKKYWTVAGNLALGLAQETGDAKERAEFRRGVMLTSDAYNVLRAKLDNAEELISAQRTIDISMEDRYYFRLAYSYLYHQRMGNLFERCHDVLWALEMGQRRVAFLRVLLRISAPLLRLFGKDEKEKRYRGELGLLLPGGVSEDDI